VVTCGPSDISTNPIEIMKACCKFFLWSVLGASLSFGLLAADSPEKDNPTKAFMKKYHKAPQGVDPVAKRATMGKATPQELKELHEGYQAMAKAKPPVGEMGSWKEKTAKLAAASAGLVKGAPDAAERFKEAANCKACHDAHRPKQ
jgi:cytochrome c556